MKSFNYVPIAKFGYVSKEVLIRLRKKIKFLIAGSSLSLALLIGISRLLIDKDVQTDAHLAYQTYEHLEESQQAVVELEKILSKHPRLRRSYEGKIAQKLLNTSQTTLALRYASAALSQIRAISPYHAQFSENSLRIVQGELSEALQAALALKRSLEEDKLFWNKGGSESIGAILYLSNLLRVGSLQQALGEQIQELHTWQELDDLSHNGNLQGTNQENLPREALKKAWAENFLQENSSLGSYICYRKEKLASSMKKFP